MPVRRVLDHKTATPQSKFSALNALSLTDDWEFAPLEIHFLNWGQHSFSTIDELEHTNVKIINKDQIWATSAPFRHTPIRMLSNRIFSCCCICFGSVDYVRYKNIWQNLDILEMIDFNCQQFPTEVVVLIYLASSSHFHYSQEVDQVRSFGIQLHRMRFRKNN